MKAESLAAVLVALSTFIGGLALAYRGLSGDRFQRKVTESAALLTGYTEMVGNLRKEIDAIRVAHGSEIERQQKIHKTEMDGLRLLHEEERTRWNEERQRLEDRVDELEGKVTALLYRPPTARDRADDRPT